MKIYFDLDDTLYEQYQPFKQAYKEMFKYDIDIYKLCNLSRKYSNEVFNDSEKGIISKEEMYVYRLVNPFKDMNIEITNEQALKFQEIYAKKQLEITLTNQMKQILSLLKDIEIGIITNGPVITQTNKIKALKLTKWINQEHIYISSKVGYSKPDKEIFELIKPDKDTYFIGDSYKLDIIGASTAKIKTIWFNRKYEDETNSIATYIVHNEQELYTILKRIVGERNENR